MFAPVFGNPWLLFLATLILGVAAWWFAPVKNGKVHWSCVVLRWCFLAVLFWVLLRPTFVQTETKTFPGSVLILTDTSRSMQVKDGTKAQTRFEEMRQTLAQTQTEMNQLAQTVDLHAWTFDSAVRTCAVKDGQMDLPTTPEGQQTAIGAALADVLQQSAGEKILGVVLLSDGAQRSLAPRDVLPQSAVARMKRQGIPLYTLCFGKAQQETQIKDVAIEDLITDQRVFIDTELVISGSVRVEGLAGVPIPVELVVESLGPANDGASAGASPAAGGGAADSHERKQVVIGMQTLQATKNSETFPVAFSWTPREAGEFKVYLRSLVREEEQSKNNNQLAAFVSVLDGGISVLYLEGAFRPEMSFLRRALNASQQIQMEVVRLSPLSPSGSDDLVKRLQNNYAAVILGDVDASYFSDKLLQTLVDKVEHGMGLLTLGGFQTYGAGGYADTPLAKVLPVEMNRSERIQPNEPVPENSALHWNEPLQMRPTEAANSSSILTLAIRPDESRQRWAKLPALDGANRFAGIKPSAVILADAKSASGASVPLLLEQTYGAGRVLTFAADSTWRWWLAGFEEDYKTFWTQAILWLAQKDNVVEGNVAITMQQRRFSQDQEIPFQISAKLSTGEVLLTAPVGQNAANAGKGTGTKANAGGTAGNGAGKTTGTGAGATAGTATGAATGIGAGTTPGTGTAGMPGTTEVGAGGLLVQFNAMADWKVEVESPDGKRHAVKLTRGTENMRGSIPKSQLPPGDYTIYATVMHKGQKVGDARCRFLVFHEDLEMDDVQAEPQLLESLALSSGEGGRLLKPSELGGVWKELAEKREELKIEQQTLLPQWDRWWWMTLLLVLLCTEWFLRKRAGFV